MPNTSSTGGLDGLGSFRRYLACMVVGASGALAAFGVGLVILDRTGHLPPPALSNRVCADEKLRFFRNHPPGAPDLAVIGSSVAWREFDGAAYAASKPGHTSINGGICGSNLRQTAFVMKWLGSNLPSLQHVLLIVAPPDTEACSTSPEAVFDPADATAYAFRQSWPGLLYLKYFDPISFVRNARMIAAQRANLVPLDPLVFTPTGDGPLNTDLTRDTLLYGRTRPDPACFDALHNLAASLARNRLSLTVVLAPTSPKWKAQVDGDASSRHALAAGVQTALDGTEATLWNADAETFWPAGVFTDALHMRWAAVTELTNKMIDKIHL